MAGRIGYEDSKGIIHSVYIHWDSFPENVGNILLTYYNSYDKAKSLIELGDISLFDISLSGSDVGPDDIKIEPVTIYYINKGKDWERVKPKKDYSSLMWVRRNPDKPFFYLYTGNRWMLIVQSDFTFLGCKRNRIDLKLYLNNLKNIQI